MASVPYIYFYPADATTGQNLSTLLFYNITTDLTPFAHIKILLFIVFYYIYLPSCSWCNIELCIYGKCRLTDFWWYLASIPREDRTMTQREQGKGCY